MKHEFYKKLTRWLLRGAGFILAAVALVGFGIYVLSWSNTPVKKIAQVIPYPVAVIDGEGTVTFANFQQKVEVIRRYHELQSVNTSLKHYELDSKEGRRYFEVAKKNLLTRMIEDTIVKGIAGRLNIFISQEEIDNERATLSRLNGGEERAGEKLLKAYKMDASDFGKVIESELLRKKVQDHLAGKGKEGSDPFDAELGKVSVRIFLKDYYWDPSNHQLKFSNPAMRDYEKSVIEGAAEDGRIE